MTQPLLIVGSIGLDDVTTPFGSVQGALGGSAVYASAAASYLAPVRFVGVAGGDLPRGAFDFLVRRGVDLEGLQSVPDGRTFRWGGKYSFDLNARDTTFTELNVLADFDPVIPARYVGTPYVLLGNLVPKVQERVLDLVARGKPPAPRPGEGSRARSPSHPFVVMDTMNFWIEGARADLDRVLARADVVIVNDAEARELAGTHNLVKAGRAIRGMGPTAVVVKKGEHGALLFDRAGIFSAPAFPLEDVFDPTGAGDAFAGGFLGHLAREDATDERALRRAVIAGSALASLCVERFSVEGLRDRPTKDVEARIEAFRELAGWG